jgi:hypothetical protein
MSGDSHARDDPKDDNNDEHQGPAARAPISSDGVSRVESTAPAGAESPGIRPPPVSSALISLCVVAGQHQRSADPLQLARALGFDPLAELSGAQLLQAQAAAGSERALEQVARGRVADIHHDLAEGAPARARSNPTRHTTRPTAVPTPVTSTRSTSEPKTPTSSSPATCGQWCRG